MKYEGNGAVMIMLCITYRGGGITLDEWLLEGEGRSETAGRKTESLARMLYKFRNLL